MTIKKSFDSSSVLHRAREGRKDAGAQLEEARARSRGRHEDGKEVYSE